MTNLKKGILMMVLSSLFFGLMSVFIKLSGDIPTMEKSFFRNIIAAFFAFIIIYKKGIKLKIKKHTLSNLIIRSIAGTLGILCNFYGVDHLLLADASILNKLSPFFAIIFSYLLIKEKISLKQSIIIIIAFVGALFVIKPTFSLEIIPFLIGLMGGLFAGLAYTEVRILGLKGVSGPFVVFFFSTFSCLIVLPFVVLNYVPLNINQALYLLLAGLSATGGQLTITAAYFYAKAKDISIYSYSQIIFVAFFGYILFEQVPDAYSLIGYLIIILMAIIMFIYNKRIKKTN